ESRTRSQHAFAMSSPEMSVGSRMSWCTLSRPLFRPPLRVPAPKLRMENKEIARLLHETADLMEVAGEDAFRIRSYRNAASVIASYPERIADIVCNPERKVTEVAGIGKGL